MTAPLWEATAAALLAEMAAGRLPDGARLPPERDMAAGLGVAVGTLRRALADIEGRGLLERRQGSGNYVRAAGLGAQVYGLFRLEPADPAAPGLPTARTLSVAGSAGGPAGGAAGGAAMPPDLPPLAEPALRIRRIRSLGGVPVALEEVWLGAAPRVPAAAEFGDSLYLDALRLLDIRIDAVEDRVGLSTAPPWAEGLTDGPDLGPPAPCAHVLRLGRDRAGARREVSRTWFDARAAHYVNRAGRTLPPPRDPAPGRARA